MRGAHAWVFAGGEYSVEHWPGNVIGAGDVVVGVDKGIEHCLATGLKPDLLIGDFDSIDPQVLNDDRLKDSIRDTHSAKKNSSDLELALHWLANKSVGHVTLFGVSGGRSDHHLFNWLLMLQPDWPFGITFVDSSVIATLVSTDNPLQCHVDIGQTVSLLPMPQAAGVSTQGLEYALHDAVLDGGVTLGLSNVSVSAVINVSVKSGHLVVFCVKRGV